MLTIKKATGVAKKFGLKKGDRLTAINGSPIADFIDEGFFNASEKLSVKYIDKNKAEKQINIQKPADVPLGLEYEENLYPEEKRCRNQCVFCFVNQLPEGMRDSLYVKDDDWRYSVLFGNYVTLTNVDDNELLRIIDRKASPLYISVHATDPECRIRMMHNKRAGEIMSQLKRLAQGGIIFHCQVVLCPGINDGAVLEKTMDDLSALYPLCRSLAIVPVGLTEHRQGLAGVEPVTKEYAGHIIDDIEGKWREYRKKLGADFIYAADEFYAKAGREYPRYRDGGYYPQLSNGVGLFHEFLEGFEQAVDELPESLSHLRRVVLATGVSAAPKINEMVRIIAQKTRNLECEVVAVENKLFGKSITVAGLLSGRDILDQVKNTKGDVLLLPPSAFRSGGDEMLDGMTAKDIEHELGYCVIIAPDDGYDFVFAVAGIDC